MSLVKGYWFGWSVIVAMALVTPIVNCVVFRGGSDVVQIAGGPGGVFLTWVAIAIFLMLYRRDITIAPIKKWVTHCSMVSLEMYLCCYIFDALYYPWFKEHFFVSQAQFLPWFFVIVPLCFLSSYAVAIGYNVVYWVVTKRRTKMMTKNRSA